MYLKTREQIIDLLHRASAGAINRSDFSDQFTHLYLHREGWPILDHRDKVFFDVILEKLYWTTDDPLPEERVYGLRDFTEFRRWLADALERYSKGETVADLDEPF